MDMTEVAIEQGLSDRGILEGTTMDEVLVQIQPYLLEQTSGCAKDGGPSESIQLSERTIDVLIGFSEFETFKDMMLQVKEEKSGRAGAPTDASVTGMAVSMDGLELHPDVEAALAKAKLVSTEVTQGWTELYNKGGLRMQRQAIQGTNFVRTIMELDFDVEHTCEMMLSMEPEDRKHWDDIISDIKTVSCFEGSGGKRAADVDDAFVKMQVKMPIVGNKDYQLRVVKVKNFPSPGAVTYAYVKWDPDGTAGKGATEGLGNGVCVPHPSDPANRTLLTMVEEMPVSVMPNFITNWAITAFMPRYMNKLKVKYKAFIDKRGS